MTLEARILSEIKPDDAERRRILSYAKELRNITEEYLVDRCPDAKVMFAGSIGKDTYLRNPDIDVFILFPETMSREDMERLGIEVGLAVLNGEKNYSEHPYISGKYKGLDVDMVPCFAVCSAEMIKSSVDRTPFHAEYILTHADDAMRDEMRLMKKFMKGVGTYGAEPNVRGFSGYLCEIITLYYGGFLNAIRAATEWKFGMEIGFGNGDRSCAGGPMTFYDPVDGRRNVASAVHMDTMSRFITAAKRYIEDPDRRFFFPNERHPFTMTEILQRLELRGSNLISVSFSRPDVLDDTLYAQIWKTESAILKRLHHHGFDPLRFAHSITENDVIFVFELSTEELSETSVHDGPAPWVPNADDFLRAWKDNPYGAPFILDGRWRVIRKRPFRDAGTMISKEIGLMGIGKNIPISTMKLRDHEDTVGYVDRSTLTELLDPRYPWEN